MYEVLSKEINLMPSATPLMLNQHVSIRLAFGMISMLLCMECHVLAQGVVYLVPLLQLEDVTPVHSISSRLYSGLCVRLSR